LLKKLIAHPLLDEGRALAESGAVLVSLMGGKDLTMAEVNRVMETNWASLRTRGNHHGRGGGRNAEKPLVRDGHCGKGKSGCDGITSPWRCRRFIRNHDSAGHDGAGGFAFAFRRRRE